MPIEDYGSYITTMNEFGIHWALVNAALGAPPNHLKLEGAFALSGFLLLRDTVQASISAGEGFENGRQIAADFRDLTKTGLRDRLGQLRAMIQMLLPQSKYASSLPVLPPLGAGESKFMAPFDDAADLWGRINADSTIAGFTPPLVIAGYALEDFVSDIAAMRAAFLAVLTAENDKRMWAKERDALLDTARKYMVQYRLGVEALLPNHLLAQTIPALYAPGGSTPNAETLTGVWNPVTSQADFTWTASSNPNLDHYQMRMSSGPSYDAATAIVIGNFPPGTTSFSTAEGLQGPGEVSSYKLFVVLTTNNEAGSNTVTIVRP